MTFCATNFLLNEASDWISPWRILVFRKTYTSSARFVRYQHEQAYLLAKGRPQLPESPIPDVLELKYTGNELHPTQKAVSSLLPLVQVFSFVGDVVLDPDARWNW